MKKEHEIELYILTCTIEYQITLCLYFKHFKFLSSYLWFFRYTDFDSLSSSKFSRGSSKSVSSVSMASYTSRENRSPVIEGRLSSTAAVIGLEAAPANVSIPDS